MQRRAFSWRGDPDVPSFPDDHPLIGFDGTCVLCSANAHFVLRRDHRRTFRLTHAQSALGLALYRHFGLRSDEQGTMILLRDGQLFTHSDAVIAIAQLQLGRSFEREARTLERLGLAGLDRAGIVETVRTGFR